MTFHHKALAIMQQVRPRLLPHYGNVEVLAEKNGAHDVVTQLDRETEVFLRESLKAVEPAIGFVGEEYGGDRKAERFWLVDPIDGTMQFIRGLPFCTSMLALVEEGEVTFSAIYDFVTDNLYYAGRGDGAHCNGERIRVSRRLARSSVTGFETRLSDAVCFHKRQHVRKMAQIVNTISAGWEFAMVACGKWEGRICLKPYGNDYDFAPGALLVKEAGGIIANIGSRTYDYRDTNLIAATPQFFRALTEGPDAPFPIYS